MIIIYESILWSNKNKTTCLTFLISVNHMIFKHYLYSPSTGLQSCIIKSVYKCLSYIVLFLVLWSLIKGQCCITVGNSLVSLWTAIVEKNIFNQISLKCLRKTECFDYMGITQHCHFNSFNFPSIIAGLGGVGTKFLSQLISTQKETNLQYH